MDKENFENIITEQEKIEMIEEKVDQEIKKEGPNIDEMNEISEELKDKGEFRLGDKVWKGDFRAGDELWKTSFEIYRQRLINRELEKRGEN